MKPSPGVFFNLPAATFRLGEFTLSYVWVFRLRACLYTMWMSVHHVHVCVPCACLRTTCMSVHHVHVSAQCACLYTMCMSAHNVHAWCLQRSAEGIKSAETGVRNDWELPCGAGNQTHIHLGISSPNHWANSPAPRATPFKNASSPFSGSYKLPVTLQLGVGLHAQCPRPCLDFVWLECTWVFSCPRNYCAFMCAIALLFPKDTVSLQSSTVSNT